VVGSAVSVAETLETFVPVPIVVACEEEAAVLVAREVAGIASRALGFGRVHLAVSTMSMTWALTFTVSWCEALLAKLPLLVCVADEQAVAVGVAVEMTRTTRLTGPVATNRE